MSHIEKLRPDELEQFTRTAKSVWFDTSCWNKVEERECPIARLLTQQEARGLILRHRVNNGSMRLMQEVASSVRQAYVEKRPAVICIVVETCGASARLETGVRLPIEKRSMMQERRQMTDDDCCCPACCG